MGPSSTEPKRPVTSLAMVPPDISKLGRLSQIEFESAQYSLSHFIHFIRSTAVQGTQSQRNRYYTKTSFVQTIVIQFLGVSIDLKICIHLLHCGSSIDTIWFLYCFRRVPSTVSGQWSADLCPHLLGLLLWQIMEPAPVQVPETHQHRNEGVQTEVPVAAHLLQCSRPLRFRRDLLNGTGVCHASKTN